MEFIDKFPNVNQNKLNSYIKRQLYIERFKKPYATGKSFTVDTSSQLRYITVAGNLYAYVPTCIKQKRVKLLLTNKSVQLSGDIKIILNQNRVELHKAYEIKTKNTGGFNKISIYFGFDNLIYTSSGNIYGKDFSSYIKKYAYRIYNKLEKRKNLQNIDNPNIKINNLGEKK